MKKRKQLDIWNNKDKCIKLQRRFGDYDKYAETGGGGAGGENKKSILRILNKLIQNDFIVLESGSGPGHFLWCIKDNCYKLISLDISPHMLELSKEQFSKNSPDTKIDFILGSCWNLPLENNTVDLSFQVDVSMHIGGSWDTIKELLRVSKKFIVFTGPSFEDFSNQMDKQLSKISWAVSVPLLNEELNKMIRLKEIKSFWYENRPKTNVYNHKILVVEK